MVQNICVYADQTKTKPIAIIVPVEPVLKKIAAEHKIEGDYSEIVHDPKLRKAVLKDMHTVGKKAGLAGIELIEGVVLSAEEWTPENVSLLLFFLDSKSVNCWSVRLIGGQSLVTSAQKLNRRGILQKYKSEIDEVYGSA